MAVVEVIFGISFLTVLIAEIIVFFEMLEEMDK